MKSTKVLHLANDYCGSTVYKNLVKRLDDADVCQIVYTAVRSPSLVGKNKIEFNCQESKILYRPILSTYTRINYRSKINRIILDLEKIIDFEPEMTIHAHTWFSDGGVAYELKQKYDVPYIVTIRSTDVNFFFKYMLHLRKYGLRILKNAKKIIFISPSLKYKFYENSFLSKRRNYFDSKSIIVPNGVDAFWIKNIADNKVKTNSPLKILYIGTFIKRKNVLRLIEATKLLKEDNILFHLTLVGGGGKHHLRILNLIEGDNRFTFKGEVRDKLNLSMLMREHDIFAMPSYNETFGLVYIEALSQGLPILYTEKEGIYGLYSHVIGEAVNSKNVNSIAGGIRNIVLHRDKYSFKPEEIVGNHDWTHIAEMYLKIYSQ